MESTVPAVLRTCTVKVSKAVVVLVSAVSMCSQKVSVAAVAFAGMLTCCMIESVVAEPWPSSQASHVPECGDSVLVLLMILLVVCVVVTVQGAGLVDPFSNPGLPRICVVPPPPAALTVRAIVVVCVTPPPVAVTVTFEVPVVAVLLAESVRVELPLPGAVMEAGLKLAVTPAGSPEAEKEIAELKPPLTVVEIVELPEPACVIERAAGDALIAKSGVAGAFTVRDMTVV